MGQMISTKSVIKKLEDARPNVLGVAEFNPSWSDATKICWAKQVQMNYEAKIYDRLIEELNK